MSGSSRVCERRLKDVAQSILSDMPPVGTIFGPTGGMKVTNPTHSPMGDEWGRLGCSAETVVSDMRKQLFPHVGGFRGGGFPSMYKLIYFY